MKFCIDTNIFFSFQKGIDLGNSPTEVVEALEQSVRGGAGYIMPPRVFDELMFLADPELKKRIEHFAPHITIQSPTIHNQTTGVPLVYELVEESRTRSLRGLHVAESILEQTGQDYMGKPPLGKIEFQKSLQPAKEALRTRYRNATRTGFIDSLADLDLIFLAKEEDAYLVSADEGLMQWGRKFGVKEMNLQTFGKTIKTSLS